MTEDEIIKEARGGWEPLRDHVHFLCMKRVLTQLGEKRHTMSRLELLKLMDVEVIKFVDSMWKCYTGEEEQ